MEVRHINRSSSATHHLKVDTRSQICCEPTFGSERSTSAPLAAATFPGSRPAWLMISQRPPGAVQM